MTEPIEIGKTVRPEVAPVPSALHSSLADLRGQIELVLQSLPREPAEARRTITREFGIDPRPKELEAISRIASDPIAGGELRELACTALALRILAGRGVHQLFDSTELSADNIGRSALLMAGLLDTVDTLETEVRNRLGRLDTGERNYVLEVVEALQPPAEPLIAGTVIAPRLLALVHASHQGKPRAAVSSLTDGEVELMISSVSGEAVDSDGVGRPGFNAVVMRTIIDDDLASWERARALDPNDAETAGRRESVLSRLKRDRTAYRFVSRRLQARQDTALVAGLHGFAEELRRVQRDLFATYLKLAPVLNGVASGDDSDEEGQANAAADLERLLRACQISDAIAEMQREGKVTNEEIFVDALRKMGQPDGEITAIFEHDPGRIVRERRRVRILSGIAAVLFVVCAVFYGHRFSRPSVDVNVPTAELPVRLELISAMSVGPMMYAQTSQWTWLDMDASARRRAVEQLGLAAFERGFSSLYLSDENDRQLAIWTKLEGSRLVDVGPPEDSAPASRRRVEPNADRQSSGATLAPASD